MAIETTKEPLESNQQIKQVRKIILGEENHLVTESIRKEARTIVTDVVTEALHDRQKQDSSVNKILQPLIEDSVQDSVTHNSERLISSLYPLVGSLVRKSVAAFLSDFIEKTNQLLENSLTIKGLKWRFKAWQAGVSFAQYAASQTFVYRVEHVFLIHRETGLLLNTIALTDHGKSDADMVSSMLSAINDFVADSFLANDDGQKEQLQNVSTDNFNLLIKPGPSALVVAAVIGNPPQQLSEQLQKTLENIHHLYVDELNNFDGDDRHFANAESLLRDCLLSEHKVESNNKRKPWLAIAALFIAFIFIGFQILSWSKSQQLHEELMQLENEPGIIIRKVTINNLDNIEVDILRDPSAINIAQWLESHNFDVKKFSILERNYHSLSPQILLSRAEKIIGSFPHVTSTWQENSLSLAGKVSIIESEQLLSKLAVAGFTEGLNLNTENLQLMSTHQIATSRQVKQQLFDDLISKISSTQLNFPVAGEKITAQMQVPLARVFQYIRQLELLANELDINIGLLVIGCSDNTGNKITNKALSLKRAENTAQTLIDKGLSKDKIFTAGLGQIDIKVIKNTARKVMFNVIYINKAQPTS